MAGKLSVNPPSMWRKPRNIGGKNPEKNGMKAEHKIAYEVGKVLEDANTILVSYPLKSHHHSNQIYLSTVYLQKS